MPEFEGINAEILEQMKQEEPDLFEGIEPTPPAPDGQEEGGEPQENPTDQGPEPDAAPQKPEEKEPEEGEEKDADGAAKKPEDKKVPLAALHEERERRKRLQQELETLRTQMGQLAQLQIEQARRAFAQQKPEEEPKDPLEELIDSKVQEKLRPLEQETAAMKQHQALEMRIRAQEHVAKQSHPDYEEITEPVMKLLTYWRDKASKGDTESQVKFQNFLLQPNPVEMAYMLGCAYRYMSAKNQQSEGVQTQPQQGGSPTPPAQKKAPSPTMPRGEGIGGGGSLAAPTIDLENITSDEWAKLPQETRNKLLMGVKI